MSKTAETEFFVSLDDSFSQGFSPTEFVVSLPVLNSSADLLDFLPRRGEGEESSNSSEGDERTPSGGGTTLGNLLEEVSSDETDSEEGKWNPSVRKIKGAKRHEKSSLGVEKACSFS
jgi:hypothetical protein